MTLMEATASGQLTELLSKFEPEPDSPHPPVVQKALYLARHLQERALRLQTPPERRQQGELDRLLQSPADKATLVQMTDQAFRTRDPHRAVEHLAHILDVQGVPRCFSGWDRTLLKGFQSFGNYAPGVALPLVKEHMQKETSNVILPGEPEMLTRHLRERTAEGLRMNVNLLGEAILSEAEAERRLQQYLQGLQWPEIEVVSIKISTLYSQISALAREHTVATLCDRLERLFRTADHLRFTRSDGTTVPKFVYLDMEEYRDKDLTAETFMRTLDRPGLEHVRAGLALAVVHPRLVPHTGADCGLGAPPSQRGWRTHHRALGQRRQPGDGTGRSVFARMAAGAIPNQDRDGRQFQAHVPRTPQA